MSTWNANKSGSDDRTKLLDSIGFQVPKNLEPPAQASVVGRELQMVSTVGHSLYQIMSSKENIKESYISLQHFRNASSHGRTFKKTVRKQALILCCWGKEDSPEIQRVPRVSMGRADQPMPQTRQQSRVDGNPFGSPATGNTPQRRVLQAYARKNGGLTNDELNVKCQREDCAGFLVLRTNPDVLKKPTADERVNGGSGECVVCGSATQWFCIFCHHWFCVRFSKARAKLLKHNPQQIQGAKQEYIRVVESLPGGKRWMILARKTCAIIGHQNRLVQLASTSSDDENDSVQPR